MNGFTTFGDEVTLLIPDFNFTCSATIFGIIVVGNGLTQQPDAKIQVWRQNDQSSVYNKLELDIPVNLNSACTFTSTLVDRVRLCILDEAFQVAVQPRDILGLKLPTSDPSNEIYFTSGGPLNYVIQRQDTFIFNKTNSLQVQQRLPQIILNLTSGWSTCCHHTLF